MGASDNDELFGEIDWGSGDDDAQGGSGGGDRGGTGDQADQSTPTPQLRDILGDENLSFDQRRERAKQLREQGEQRSKALLQAEEMSPGTERDEFKRQLGEPVVGLPSETIELPATTDEDYPFLLGKAERETKVNRSAIRRHGDVALVEHDDAIEHSLHGLPKDSPDPAVRRERERLLLERAALARIVEQGVASGTSTESAAGSETRSYPANFDPAFGPNHHGGEYSSKTVGGRLVEYGVDANGVHGERWYGYAETAVLKAAQADRKAGSGSLAPQSPELRAALAQIAEGPGHLRLDVYAAVQDPGERQVMGHAIQKLPARQRSEMWDSLQLQAEELS